MTAAAPVAGNGRRGAGPLRVEAPAKVNRELRVGARRPDGFHEVRSRIVSIDLADRIEISESGGERVVFTCEGNAPGDETNLVVRAAEALARRLGRPPAARIHLEKQIPVGAGLGGGSSDAAVTLRALCGLWGAPLEMAELAELASALGSDVPYFLQGGEAEVSGRGERVAPLEDSPAVELLLLVPPFSIETSRVYRAHRGDPMDRPPGRLARDAAGKFFARNDLAFAVLETEERMRVFVESVASLSNDFIISGSGSTIVLHGADARAEAELARRHPDARLIRSRTLSRVEFQRRSGISGGS